MSSILNFLHYYPKTTKVVSTFPVVGAIVPIAITTHLTNVYNELSNNEIKMIRKSAGVQLLSCGIAGTSAYLLLHYAAFATVFKVSAIGAGFLLGGVSFFIAPAVILGLYGLYLLYKKISCCSSSNHQQTDTSFSSARAQDSDNTIVNKLSFFGSPSDGGGGVGGRSDDDETD